MARDGFPWFRKEKGCWYVYRGGKQVRLAADKAEAFKVWHEMELGLGKAGETATGPTIAEVVDGYLSEATGRLKSSSIGAKRRVLGRFKAQMGDRAAGGLKAGDVRGWLDRQKWGRSTRWLAASIVKAAFRQVAPDVANLSVPGPLSRGASTQVTRAQHEQLLAAARPSYHDALTVLWETGCRPGELCSIEARHIDSRASALVLDQHKTDSTGRPRVIVLSPSVLALCLVRAAHFPAGPIFRDTRGRPLTPDKLRLWMLKTCRRLGLPHLSPYGFRHGFATDALVAGVPDAQVAALLGHSSTTMLHRHYSHLTARAAALRSALEKVRKDASKDGGEGEQ
jgi:integrase